MNRRLVIIIGFLVIGGWLINQILLAGGRPVNLKSDLLAYQTARSLQGQFDANLPLQGKDYKLKEVFLESNTWAVVSVIPIGASSDPGTIVFKFQDNAWQAVLGPSNYFNAGDVTNLPSAVTDYLKRLKVL